jgi:hypothetical protein
MAFEYGLFVAPEHRAAVLAHGWPAHLSNGRKNTAPQ